MSKVRIVKRYLQSHSFQASQIHGMFDNCQCFPPVSAAVVMPRLPGDGVVIQNVLGVVEAGVALHKTLRRDLK